jgi:hypothetical protein
MANFDVNAVKGLMNKPMSAFPRVMRAENAANAFLKASNTTAQTGALVGKNTPKYLQYANKGPMKYIGKIGTKFNSGVANAAQKVGGKMVANINKGGFLSKIATKVPFVSKIANGLSKTTASKIPGLGTLFAIGTGVVGLFKAGGKLLKGDIKGAGHQVLKSAGSVAGIGAGLALMATGVGFLPGLALAIGAGFAGDWAGKKAGDMVFGKMDENGHSPEWNAKQGMTQSPYGQNFDYTVGGVAGMNDQQFDAYVASILKGSVV